MPPKSTAAAPPARSTGGNSGGTRDYATYIYREMTAAENQSVLRSVALFGVSELLLSIGREFLWLLGLARGHNLGVNQIMEASEREGKRCLVEASFGCSSGLVGRQEMGRAGYGKQKVDANDIAGCGSFFRQQLERVPVATVSSHLILSASFLFVVGDMWWQDSFFWLVGK